MMKPIATFSIVAYDPGRQEWGVAVQSKFLAVGAVVPWARAGAGAVATQSYANLCYGPDGLDLMAAGLVCRRHNRQADHRRRRPCPAPGRSGRCERSSCRLHRRRLPRLGRAHVGEGYTCQGNILVPGTVEAMAAAFEAARRGAGELADWLVSAHRRRARSGW